MRLDEIISTKLGKPQPAQDPNELSSDPEALGHGSYAKVQPDPSDPHMVLRKEYKFTDPRSNGYFQWARRIREEAEHNPYLPRIYEISQEIDPGNSKQRRFTYKLERLREGYELSPQQALAVARAALNNFDEHLLSNLEFQHYLKQYARTLAQFHPDKVYPPEDKKKIKELGRKVIDEISSGEIDASNNELPWIIWSVFSHALEEALRNSDTKAIKSGELLQAYDLIVNLNPRRVKTITDINSDNIMVRLHPLQLVITDPLS